MHSASHFDLKMSPGIGQTLRLNGAAMLFCWTLLLAPQVVVGADNAQNPIDPYERAHRSWQSKTPLSTKIIKGRSVTFGDHSWQVALLNASIPDPLYAHFCSGTLITDQWVVTAAHCVARRQATELTVLTGTSSLNLGGQKKNVISIVVHAAYDPHTLENDLALLFLEIPTFNAHNAYPQFPSLELEQQLFDDQEKVKIAGWGNTYDFRVKSLHLMETEAPLVPYHLCSAPDSHGQSLKATTMLCAGYEDERTDACDGDSGGPATIRHYGQEFLIGIKSWGDCGAPKKYGVFTRIAPYVGWIRANTHAGLIRTRSEYLFPGPSDAPGILIPKSGMGR
ncbi:MAG: serine protease [Nitrosospira sp.]|nr:serine protease [Nitrosospira sp.]